MCECIDDLGEPLEPIFCVVESKIHEVVFHNHKLFNCTWTDDIMSQTSHQEQPPRAKHAVREDEILIWLYPEVLGVIYLPCSSASSHKLRIYRWD